MRSARRDSVAMIPARSSTILYLYYDYVCVYVLFRCVSEVRRVEIVLGNF